MHLERLKKGSTLNGDSGSDPTVAPEWLDYERFRKGQKFFINHMSSATFALHCSVTVGFVLQTIIEPLGFNKRSNTGPKASLRYIKTFIHAALWHLQDVWDETTLAHKSTQTVRQIHKRVRESMEAKNGGTKKYVTQYDMALVQGGFIGSMLLYPKEFGINCTREELEDYVYYWRGIGYLLGIHDDYNICSRDYEYAYNVCKEIEDLLVYPGLLEPPPLWKGLSDAYIDGANRAARINIFTKTSIIQFTMWMSGHSVPWMQCTWTDYLRIMGYRLHTFLLRWLPGFESFLNYMHMRLFKRFSYLIDKEIAKFNLYPK